MTQKAGSLIAVSFIEPAPLGVLFERTHWPLHVTVVPWFEADEVEAQHALDDVAARHAPFDAHVGEQQLFGPSHRIPVNVISPSDRLVRLHTDMLKALGSVGARNLSKWSGGDWYTPHITRHGDRYREAGDVERIGSFSLVRLMEDGKLMKVADYFLHGDTDG